MVVYKTIRFQQLKNEERKYYSSGEYLHYITRADSTKEGINPKLYDFDGNKINLKSKIKKMSRLNPEQWIWDNTISFPKSKKIIRIFIGFCWSFFNWCNSFK